MDYSTPICCCKPLEKVYRQIQGSQRGMWEARTRQARRWKLSPSVLCVWSSEGRHYRGTVLPTEAYWRWDVLGGAGGFGTLYAGFLGTWTEFLSNQEAVLNSLLQYSCSEYCCSIVFCSDSLMYYCSSSDSLPYLVVQQ